MNKIYLSLIALMFFALNTNAQSLEELKTQKAQLESQATDLIAKADAVKGELNTLQREIDLLSGWRKGFAGNIGFDLNNSNNWVSAPNPSASSTGLGIGVSAFANKTTEKTIWNNKLIIAKGYRDVDQNLPGEIEDGLFDDANGVTDILNLSSLYGYRIHPQFAITALGELNSSVSNFLKPGTADIGVGGTWTPNSNLTVVVHPFNYRLAWAGIGAPVESTNALGAKLRADYNNTYTIAGKNFGLSSTLTSFLPYSNPVTNVDGIDVESDLFEYTWLNTISFELWRGIGVGVGFGFRGADFEIQDETQTYYNLGLTYTL